MGKLFYRLFTLLYPVAVAIVSPFNGKARLWLNGRKDVFEHLKKAIKPHDKIIWMHCASLGEFEQGRPVIERLKQPDAYPDYKVLITFFSPSGYEVQKNYAGADHVIYLPMDSPAHSSTFFDLVHPSLILFVKYEFWYYYLNEAKRRKIPLLLISGIFRKEQTFFTWYGSFYRKMLACFTHLFVQDESSAALLQKIGLQQQVSISGDTRFDRVKSIAGRFEPVAAIEAFCGEDDVVVAGSTWPEDDKALSLFANTHPEVKFIIAPHLINQQRIAECQQWYERSVLFSQLDKSPIATNINVLVIDNIGMLSRLYKYATVAYIGGGFGEGIHNTLEAAVFYKPVVFGPAHQKFAEARALIACGGARSVTNATDLKLILENFLLKETNYYAAAEAAGAYVQSQPGATKTINSYIQEKRLLTN